MTAVLATFRQRETTGWDDAWAGLEPTFQTRKSVGKWARMSEEKDGEEAYFEDDYMLGMEKSVARRIVKSYRAGLEKGDARCMFATVERKPGPDQWGVQRQNVTFNWKPRKLEPFAVRVTLDPETFEYSIKPVPLAWFYDERFVGFMQRFVFDAATKEGLSASIAHGGGQFSLSAKTFMTGSLLADDIATRLDHPELSLFVMDWPNPDDRTFRATAPRLEACQRVIDAYWRGGFHPRAIGTLTPELVQRDAGYGPSPSPPRGLMDARKGPKGSAREVFQTNFAFGRAFRLQAQAVHPGYWQSANPDEIGYRPDQIMRYSEANLNRLQLAGELHVKSSEVLDKERAPACDAPLDISMLATEASYENRAQMGRTSAADLVEALLLDVHHARWLQAHPHPKVRASLLQDQLLSSGEATVKKHAGPKALEKLKAKARKANLEASEGRVVSERIEPETLMWAAWKALPKGARAAIAVEAVDGFVERVERAAETDPRPMRDDPMEPHRHRILPVLWEALEGSTGRRSAHVELRAWSRHREKYLARRPAFSQMGKNVPPWQE